jgi:peptidyl-prolyl cis-trans isomerase C
MIAMASGPLGRLLREPLLYFFLLGGVIFAVMPGADDPGSAGPREQIVISGAEVERLTAAWSQRWQRPPTEAEVKDLITEMVREQVLYREALALGLDRDDVVIRRHLRQKYEFLSQDLAFETDPDEATLRAFFKAGSDRYAPADRLTFSQILFSPDRRGALAAIDATRALADLQTATAPDAAETLGDATSLPSVFTEVETSGVEAVFGPEFAAAVMGLEPGRWSGPVASGYGLHLVWLSEKVAGDRPAFEDVRQKVKDDWVYSQRAAANDAIYRGLLERYEVVIEPDAMAPETPGGGS